MKAIEEAAQREAQRMAEESRRRKEEAQEEARRKEEERVKKLQDDLRNQNRRPRSGLPDEYAFCVVVVVEDYIYFAFFHFH